MCYARLVAKRVAASLLCVRFSPGQLRQVRRAAEEANVSLSEYVRTAAMRATKACDDEEGVDAALRVAASCSA